ncbi:MAG: hypothetical protein U5L72_02200 [Bacteroidales bacterium]|nr:hypothetical protein [Bacteroidales bacterium]
MGIALITLQEVNLTGHSMQLHPAVEVMALGSSFCRFEAVYIAAARTDYIIVSF